MTPASHSKLWGTAVVSYNLYKYTLTADESIQSKTYYTRSGSEGSYIYTAVADPVVGNIGTYYERANASAVQIKNLVDRSLTVRLTGGARTRVIGTAPAGQSQAQFAASGFSSSGVGSHADLTWSVTDGVVSFATTDVYYSVAGQLNAGADMTAAQVEAAGSWTDDTAVAITGNSIVLTVA